MSQGIFRIEAVLGRGAHAIVALANRADTPDEEPIVLKVIRRDLLNNAEAFDRLRDEGRILTRVDHPNILRVNRVLDYEGQPVVEMEFIQGVSLENLLSSTKAALPSGIALHIARNVAEALDTAYNGSFDVDGQPMKIIHRDLNPENIVLDVNGVVKIVDFGVAKGDFANREAKSLYLTPGSRGYVSPEHLEGMKDSPAVDVYALGATLFKLLTGKTIVASMHRDRHDDDVKRQVAYLELPELPEVEALRQLIIRMVSRDADLRPSMPLVVKDLETFIAVVGGHSDLQAYAQEFVRPLIDAVEREPARNHPNYEELRFLEETVPSGEAQPLPREEALAAVRDFLSREGWEERIPDLQRLLKRSTAPIEKPFHQILDRAEKTWWKPWQRQATPKQLSSALVVLCDFPSEATAERARKLVFSESTEVATAAKFFLKLVGE